MNSGHSEATSDTLPPHYFELYKMAVEMTDRISSRRIVANTYFATVHTGLIALISDRKLPWYVSAAGIVLSLVWWSLLKSYRDLNEAKFIVVLAMEELLPVKVFKDEWDLLRHKAPPQRVRWMKLRTWLVQYRELGQVERIVPAVFAIVYFVWLVARISQ